MGVGDGRTLHSKNPDRQGPLPPRTHRHSVLTRRIEGVERESERESERERERERERNQNCG